MLTCKVGNNIINTIDYTDGDIRKWSNKGILKCPVCNMTMIFKHGKIKVAHFAHEKDSNCLDIYSEPESEEHLQGKKIIYEWLKTQNNIKNIKLESYIPETKQRPDLYFEINNKRYVIEFQCTPIASEYLERRELYKLAGINDLWILGTKKYNIEIFSDFIAHSDRFKEIEKYNNLYLDIDTGKIIICKNIIMNCLKYKVLQLDNYYIYSINDVNFNEYDLQIVPSVSALSKLMEEDNKKYLEVKDELERKEKERINLEIKREEELALKQKLELECKELIQYLNKNYKIVKKNCKFNFEVGSSIYYLGKIIYESDCGDYTFFIKSNKIDCCSEEPCTRVQYLGGRGRHGGLRRRYYSSYKYVNKYSMEYEDLDIEIIKQFICTNVSNLLRNCKYGR